MDRQPGPSDSHDQQAVLEQLGRSLRDARQQQGLSLSALAAMLRMGDEQLRALEDGNQARLPEAVFVIAQSRRVADALGIDVTPLVAPLKQAAHLAPHPAALSRSAAGERRAAPPLRLPWPLLACVALLTAAGGAVVWGWPQLRQLSSAAHSRASVGSPAAGTTAQPKPSAMADELRLSSPEPSWLEVQTSSGAVLFQGTLQGERRFPLKAGLRVKAGRPDLVQASFRDHSPKALGPIDQIRWVSFQAGRAPAPAP